MDFTECGQAVVAKALLRTETTCLNSKCKTTTECVDPSWLVACTLADDREDLTTLLDGFFQQDKPEDWRPDVSQLTGRVIPHTVDLKGEGWGPFNIGAPMFSETLCVSLHTTFPCNQLPFSLPCEV